ncbi:AAA family ATPase [Alkalihalophilus marmarensis]|uniref:replicative DNA helicase n=1 Tax=Alkalihalophilus marmarensis TaxID=521377 RepID=UPI00203D9002|nr:DnaB-like helicase C-terminal domain-containing protein [Alkalihalophilus marmarensis]MCM3487871.1 AAA family ATPase [Alkalihalophilus marmarensis]
MNSLLANDISAEQSVLGAILLDSAVIDDVMFLEERDFALKKHQQLFKVIKYMDESSKPIDLMTVTEEYHKFGQLDDIGGVNYLSDLVDACPTTSNVSHYGKIVRSKAIRRRGIEIGKQIEDLSSESFPSDEDYFSAVEDLVENIRPQNTGEMESLKEFKESYFKHLTTPVSRVLTGFSQFDEWSNGLGRTDLFVSAGRPSMGKTAMLLQRIRGILENQSSGVVLLWSQEMSKHQIVDRMISNATEIKFPKINQKKLDDFELEVVKVMYEKLEQKPIFVRDAAGVSIQEIRSVARQFKRKYGKIDLIAVDYLQIMKIPQANGESRSQAIGNVTGMAKRIAKEMDCPFMLLSQMTRESEMKKKPTLADLKESGAIEQDADVVEFLWEKPDDKKRGGKVVQQFIAKGRNIGINEFRLFFRGYIQKFRELRDDEKD